METKTGQATEVVAFRVSADVKRLLQAAAARRDQFVSDVLRSAVRDSLREEFGSDALPDREGNGR